MSVHRRIADLIPSHGEGQFMTLNRLSALLAFFIVAEETSFHFAQTDGGQNGF